MLFSIARGASLGYLVTNIIGAAFPVFRAWMQGLLINILQHLAGAGLGAVTAHDWLIFSGFLFATVMSVLVGVVESYFFWLVWFAMGEWNEVTIIKKKAELDVAMHEDKEVSDLHNRVTENLGRVPNFTDRMFDAISEVTTIVLTVGVLIVAEWKLFLIIMLATIPELIVEMKFGKRIWSIHSTDSETRRRYWEFRGHFLRLPDLIELKLFQNIPHFLSIIREMYIDFMSQQRRAQRFKAFNALFTRLFSQGAIVYAIIAFGLKVLDGDLLVGTFIFYLATIGQFRSSLSHMFQIVGQQYGDSLFVTDLFDYLKLKPRLVSPPQGYIVASGAPDIVFEHVTFTYPGTKKPVLKNFSVHIPPGQRFALVGVNGAGKTTFVKLLCRFYDPDEGRILINGHDLMTVDLES